MAESRFKPISEDELASVVDRQIRQSVMSLTTTTA